MTHPSPPVVDDGLLPCPVPWCLGEADADWYAVGEQDRPYWVRCKACGCKTPRQYATVAEAIAAWNTRDQSQSARIAYSLDDWQALVRIIGENVKETDGPDRVRWEGVWYDGPLATAYLKTLRAIEKMAKRNVASLTKDSTSG